MYQSDTITVPRGRIDPLYKAFKQEGCYRGQEKVGQVGSGGITQTKQNKKDRKQLH